VKKKNRKIKIGESKLNKKKEYESSRKDGTRSEKGQMIWILFVKKKIGRFCGGKKRSDSSFQLKGGRCKARTIEGERPRASARIHHGPK